MAAMARSTDPRVGDSVADISGFGKAGTTALHHRRCLGLDL